MAGQIAYTIPPLTTPGPAYATQVDAALTAIQTHTHDGVDAGATIDIAAQACNEDLSIAHHNLTNVRSVQFDNEPAALTGSQDVLNIYVNQGNLYYNNSDGTPIQLTSGTTPAPSGIDVLNWIMRANGTPVTAAFSILATDVYNLVALNSASGPFTGTLPISAAVVPTAVGRLYLFRDATGSCGTHAVTIQVAPGSGDTFEDDGSTAFVINSKNAYLAIYTDGHGKWFVWSQNVYQGETVGLNGTFLNVSNSSSLTVDASSSLGVVGGFFLQSAGIHELQNAQNVISGGTLSVDTGAITTYSGGAAEIFATGTAATFQSGSTLALASGSTCNANGQLNLGGTCTLSGTVNGSVTFSSLAITGAALTVSCNVSSSISNSGTTTIAGECFNVVTVSGNYTVDSGGTHLDRYLSVMLTASANWTITLPGSPAVGRLITIADGNGQDPSASPGYDITIAGGGNNILNFFTTVSNTSPPYSGSSTTQQLAAPGTAYPAAGHIQGSGWAITLIWTGSVWARYAAAGIY